VKKLRPIHHAPILSYLKASGYRVGLLMNFNVRLFVNGLKRFVK
jgi:GxxExxY protein